MKIDQGNLIKTPCNDIKEIDIINQWVNEAPHEKNRETVSKKIKEACQTGVLELDYFAMNKVSSLPPIPENVSSLKISNADALRTLPPLPENLKK